MKIQTNPEFQIKAYERLEGDILPNDVQPLILHNQPRAFTTVPRESMDFWKEYFFGSLKIEFDAGRFAENGTTSWCDNGADVGFQMWACDCDAS